jgi:hypothetical protein
MDVIGQIRQDQATQDQIVLVNWACVASTYGPDNAAGDPTFPLATAGGLRVPLADDNLAAQRWSCVFADHGDNSTEVLSLSHILRGECNSNCTRRAAHQALTQTKVS